MSDDQPQSSTTEATPGNTADSSPKDTSSRVGASGRQSSVVGKPLDSPSWATIAGLVGGVTAVLAVLRYAWSWARPKPKTPDQRLTEATQALGTAAAGLGGRAARRTASVAERTASTAEPVVREAAARAADVAQDAAGFAAGIAAGGARKVASAAAEGASEVAEGVETVQKAWNKFMRRLTILVFGSAGYVLGARAGRERYEQIVGATKQAQGMVQGARQ